MTSRSLVVYCGLLLTVGAFSVDITLPFFSIMREALRCSDEAIQGTVTIYVAGMGIGQIVFGPVSDRYGRRPAIAAGLGIYLVGATVALLSSTIEVMLAGRALQGLGAAAGPVVGRAILRDLFTGPKLAQNMALATGIFSFGPIFAPLIGVGIAQAGGSWRSIFVGMALFALVLLGVLLRAPETLAARRIDALHLGALVNNIATVFRHRQSRYFILLAPVVGSTMLLILTGMPRVFEHEFGITGPLFAVLFALHGFGIIFGQFLNHRMIARRGAVVSALLATSMMILATGLITLCARLHWLDPYLLAFFGFVFAIGYLIVVANAASLTLDPHGAIAGSVSSIYGFFVGVSSAALATLIVVLTESRVLLWGLSLLGISLSVAGALLYWLRHPMTIRADRPS